MWGGRENSVKGLFFHPQQGVVKRVYDPLIRSGIKNQQNLEEIYFDKLDWKISYKLNAKFDAIDVAKTCIQANKKFNAIAYSNYTAICWRILKKTPPSRQPLLIHQKNQLFPRAQLQTATLRPHLSIKSLTLCHTGEQLGHHFPSVPLPLGNFYCFWHQTCGYFLNWIFF